MLNSSFFTKRLTKNHAEPMTHRSGAHKTSVSFAALLFAVSLLLLPPAYAGQPWLWQVDHPSLSQPSYLFGTIHSAQPELLQFAPIVVSKFNEADAFYAELDLSLPSMMKAMGFFMSPSPNAMLNEMSPQQKRRAQTVLSGIHPNLKLENFAAMKLWAFMATLPMLEEQVQLGDGAIPMDMQLYQRASTAQKQVGGLETIEEQVAVFEAFSQKEHLLMLDASLDYLEAMQAQDRPLLQDTYDAYQSGKLGDIAVMMDAQMQLPSALEKKLNNELIVKRNNTMAYRIADLVRSNKSTHYFFAIGVGHFYGTQSIPVLLRNQGFKVTRIQ